jgi:hypothetical protein
VIPSLDTFGDTLGDTFFNTNGTKKVSPDFKKPYFVSVLEPRGLRSQCRGREFDPPPLHLVKYTVLELQTRAQAAFVEGDFVAVRLEDGREIRFPISANRRLREATPAERARIEITCNGTGLHWPDLDEDLSLVGILEGRLGPG